VAILKRCAWQSSWRWKDNDQVKLSDRWRPEC
jgi:hypothetical protein